MPKRAPLRVAVSLDVEEEGLFCGRYLCRGASARNVAHLRRLEPLLERGIKPTLFCSWVALTDADARGALEKLAPRVEIGAHLHHWNTPPIAQNIPASGVLKAVPAHQQPLQSLDSKLAHLADLLRDFLGQPARSFRMGRWDLHKALLPLLYKYGFRADASVRPLHCFTSKDKGPDHFNAPADPYWIDLPKGRLLEVPVTVVPLLSPLAHAPARFAWGRRLRASLRRWGVLALLPVQHPLWLMRLTTNLHVNSGGRALSLTWHSSEMMPGGAPHMPDEESVSLFMAKIGRFLDWLEASFDVSYATISEQAEIAAPAPSYLGSCDWTWPAEGAHGG